MPIISPQTQALRTATLVVFALLLAFVVFVLGRNAPAVSPKLGTRGLKRQRALAEGGLFKTFEPMIRFIASWIARVQMPRFRQYIDMQLVYGGDWLGITPDEYLSIILISAFAFGGVGYLASSIANLPPFVIFVGAIVGGYVPKSRLDAEIALRFKQVNRSLPVAIDLAALCMGAGLDFPGSIRQYVEKAGIRDALHEEFSRILQELELGRTRRQALENFAWRAPTNSAKDFVSSVVQAEAKGNPLVDVLRTQARMLRMSRSVMAEEAAANAAVKLMGPLMLIFVAIILVLLGPFIVQATGKGF